jgi:alanine racemase
MNDLIWVELDAKAPEHNLGQIKKTVSRNVLICAVIKANGYGHGMEQMTGLLPSADWFGVATLDEALTLRSNGIKKPVLVLGYVPLKRLHEALEFDIRLTVFNRETIDELGWLALPDNPARVHLKIETGTGRQGVLLEELPEFVDAITSAGSVRLEGVSTHFANIEDTLNHQYSENQLAVFRGAVESLREMGQQPPIMHAACTAAGILFPSTHFSMVRTGIGLYGLWPSRETYISARMACADIPLLKPVLSWKTRIAQIKTLPEGSYIGYGCTFRTTRTTRVAVLPVGYADGYDRNLGNIAYVLINGKRAPVVGRVCMNITMIDITDIPDVRLENEVVLLGEWGEECITAETMASWAGTINYEIVARISPHLSRRVVTR